VFESPNTADRLPSEVASFVGRAEELHELAPLLETTRILSITGIAGSGKTRLALRLARTVASRYPDGVALASLAPVSESRQVARTVASALGVRGSAGRPLLATLASAIGTRHILFVFDNCEHLIGASAQLAETLLSACPRLRILATSREPLRVSGETVFRLAPFAVPEEQTSIESATRSDAVALFVERARARMPQFELTDGSAREIVTICRRVDGIPLAIELAAAQVGPLTVRQIAQRLDGSLSLLRRGTRTNARQETLRGTLDWSHNLLTDTERILFRRLAVFAGSFDLDAVTGTVVDDDPGEGDTVDSLTALVEKSLIEVDTRADPVRYRLLEPIRQYAAEHLAAAGETEPFQRRHATYYMDLVETAEPRIRSGERRPWMDRLADAEDNIRVALSWSRRAPTLEDREIGLRLVGTLAWYWVFRGQVGEGLEWTEAALASARDAGARARGRALFGACELAWLAGQATRARAYAEESEKLLRTAGDKRSLGYLLQSLPMTIGNPRSVDAVAESMRLFEEVGDAWGAAMTLAAPDLFALVGSGDPTGEGRARLEASLARWRTLGDPWGTAMGLNMLGDLERSQGMNDSAAARYEEALLLLREQELMGTVPSLLHNLGHLALRAGTTRRALSLFRESLALFREQGDQRGVADALDGMAGVVAAMRQPVRAARLLGTADALRDSIGADVWPANLADRERIVKEIERQIGAGELRAARDAGRLDPADQTVAELLAERTSEQSAVSDPLTEREREVAALVAQGLTNRQIGERLFITEGTAKLHVKHILQKLDMTSRAQIAARVAEGSI